MEVSILVLMEVTLKALSSGTKRRQNLSFNPCFNGSDSKSPTGADILDNPASFNPCFNGSDSKSPKIC